MKLERIGPVAIICFILLLLLIVVGAKTFTLNSQAWEMWRYFGHDPLGALLSGHPHGVRYVVYYPVFAVAQLLNAPPDLVFSYACALVLLFMSVLVGRVIVNVWAAKEFAWQRDIVVACIFAMSMLMNGRMVMAFCGYLLITFTAVDWFKNRQWRGYHMIGIAFGCLLAGASSGTLLVAMALAAGVILITLVRDPATLVRIWYMPLSIILVLSLFAVPAVIGLGKNLAFYGGDSAAVVRMLGHGAGGDIASAVGMPIREDDAAPPGGPFGPIVQFWWVFVLIAAAAAYGLGWRPLEMIKQAAPQENAIHLAILLALVGGLYGYSVLTMAFIPTLIFLAGRGQVALEHVWRRSQARVE